ncbi:unnamed protein product [Heligmosomoides polygyrus]|uniref:Uncharacterized protein n=1 Tax=Heligmosomoides polygyrus TaxID=6339 RepID=A0A183GKH7_HELPZ|nr:unnamed protein product [Heligmosomoides polygyrus]
MVTKTRDRAQRQAREGTPGCVRSKLLVLDLLLSLTGSLQAREGTPGCGASKLLVRELLPSSRALLKRRWKSRDPSPTAQRPSSTSTDRGVGGYRKWHRRYDTTARGLADEGEPPPSASAEFG